ncbi:MAG: TonB-dependent receptor family protein, partial [Myxococcales bacterium]
EPSAPAEPPLQRQSPTPPRPIGTPARDGPIVLDAVKIKTSMLEQATPEDVFEHAGGRTVIDQQRIQESGANALPDVLRKTAGVKVVEATGTGNTDTKLNIGIRGLDPRLTGRSTVLLDEIPIVVAPYGQPQASLFPVSLFSINKIDVVRGGAAMRFGPQTVGGVINLQTAPVPEKWEAKLALQGDQYANLLTGLALGNTFGPVGIYGEYSFRGGQSFRDNSDQQIHAAILKAKLQLTEKTVVSSLLHFYDEDSGLPGGLFPEAFAVNPRQSLRPNDRFTGTRQGAALKATHDFTSSLRAEVLGFYNRSKRDYVLADEPVPLTTNLQQIPRDYDVLGVEPRLGWKLKLGDELLVLNTGYRYVFESSHNERINRYVGTGLVEKNQDDDSRLGAHATYLQADLWLMEQTLRLSGGTRFESVRIRRVNNLERSVLGTDYNVLLPGASVWFSPLEELAVFASYGRSFGSPQYQQLGLARSTRQLTAEIADTGEIGVKLLELKGVTASLTAFV